MAATNRLLNGQCLCVQTLLHITQFFLVQHGPDQRIDDHRKIILLFWTFYIICFEIYAQESIINLSSKMKFHLIYFIKFGGVMSI